ncbi:MAG: tyrosine-type recombinase/integrase [Candidatus Dormiibacterota bacterium]
MGIGGDILSVADEEDRSLLFAAELFSAAANQESSKEEYRGVLRSLLRHLESEGVSLCSQLTWPHLYSYQAAVSRLAPSTRHHRLLLVRQFLRFLEGCGWTGPGMWRAIRIQPLPPHQPGPALSLDDQLSLIAAAPNLRTRLLVSLMLATGARPGELLACDLSSVQDGQLQLRGKTGARWVPLPPSLHQELEDVILGRYAEGTGAPLFRSRQGRLSRRRFRELLDECSLRAGLGKVSPHQLRHAACARWLRAGVPLLLVSKALGHARPSTTLDHYASVISQDLERGLSLDPLGPTLAQRRAQPRPILELADV